MDSAMLSDEVVVLIFLMKCKCVKEKCHVRQREIWGMNLDKD